MKSKDKIEENKKHIDNVLSHLKGIYKTQDIATRDTVKQLLIFELLLANDKWEYDLVSRVFYELEITASDFNYDNFERIHKSLNYSINRKYKEFSFFIYTNYPLEGNFNLLNNSVEVLPNSKIVNQLIEKAMNDLHFTDSTSKIEERNSNGYVVIKFIIEESSLENAFNKFNETLFLLKGILEYTYSYGMFIYSLTSTQTRIASYFNLPEFVIIKEEEREYSIALQQEATTKPKIYESKVKQEKVKSLLDLYCDSPSKQSTLKVIKTGLELYGKAFDSLYKAYTFQYLWNLLEEVTFSFDSGGNTDEVIKKMRNYFTDDFFNTYSNILANLEIRNDLVHKGKNGVNDLHINFLKILCEGSLDELIMKHKEVNTIQKIKVLYRTNGVPSEQLKEELEMISYVLVNRENNKLNK